MNTKEWKDGSTFRFLLEILSFVVSKSRSENSQPSLLTNWNCVSCGLTNALKREQCQACLSQRSPWPECRPECIWASRENPQFFEKYNQFAVHTLYAAHYRMSCHNSLSVVHGDQLYCCFFKHGQLSVLVFVQKKRFLCVEKLVFREKNFCDDLKMLMRCVFLVVLSYRKGNFSKKNR